MSGSIPQIAVGAAASVFSMFFGQDSNMLSQLGYLELDVLVTENLSLPSEVTKYPIEDGSEISDHITEGSEELTITGSISSATSFGFEFGYCKSKLIDAVDTLRRMHKQRDVFTIVTGLGQYENMAFTALSFNRGSGDKGGNWIDINAQLRQIKKVSLKQAELPPDKATGPASGRTGSTEKKSGASGTPSQPPNDDTVAATLVDKTGLTKSLPHYTPPGVHP